MDNFVPRKRRSGRQVSGFRQRAWLTSQGKMVKVVKGDDDVKRQKYGPDYKEARTRLNRKYPGMGVEEEMPSLSFFFLENCGHFPASTPLEKCMVDRRVPVFHVP